MLFPPELIDAVKAEDLETLAALDARGLLAGKDENGLAFATRLEKLEENISELETDLDSEKGFKLDGLTFKRKDRIPQNLFADAAAKNRALYDFSVDWVPGFYRDPRQSFLFGGCSYTSCPDFFAIFLIRAAFAKTNRWLWYDRDELFSHELCHVARSGMDSRMYEEHLAYRTSEKQFRKVVGSVLYSTMDTFLILGGVLLPLIIQFAGIYMGKPMPAWPGWLLIVGLLLFYANRWRVIKKRTNRAEAALTMVFGDQAQAVLFRCTDEEINDLATLAPEKTGEWLKTHENNLRWRVTCHRFKPSGASN